MIPGTLVVGHALPVVTQALFFISVVDVDPWQMTMLIVACVAGGWLGAGVVASLSRRAVQLGMGCALLIAAAFMLLGMLGLFPAGGTALASSRRAHSSSRSWSISSLARLVTLGIGNYAPSLDHVQPPRHGPASRVSDHDGFGRRSSRRSPVSASSAQADFIGARPWG